MKKIFKFLLRFAVSAGLLAYFLLSLAKKHGGIGKAARLIFDNLRTVNFLFILIATSLILIGILLASIRWKMLLLVYSRKIALKELFSYYLMAAFFNNFFPSTIGGDALRAYKAKKIMGETTSSVTVIIIERLTGMFALVMISLTGLLLKKFSGIDSLSYNDIIFFLFIAVFGFAVLIVLTIPVVANFFLKKTSKILPAWLHGFLKKSYTAVSLYYRYPKAFLSAVLISLCFQFNMVFYYFFILKAIGLNFGIIECMTKIPLVVFLLMVVPAVNGLGVRTAGFSEFMGIRKDAFAVEIIDISIRLFVGLIGGLVFLVKKEKDFSKKPMIGSE
jgi:uncharacterized protein (TIRG00374 family)